MNQINQTKLADLEKQHGACAHLETNGKLFVFRTPTLDEWEDAQDGVHSGKVKRGAVFRQLAQQTLVFPELAELQALFQRKPAIAAKLSDALTQLAGADEEIVVKKG